jgi:hypothetical protein
MSEYDTLPWEVVKIPAWLDEEAADLLELPIGGSYFPEWKPDDLLRIDEAEIKASNGSRYWNSLYMQDPTPEEGGLIKKKWIQEWEYDEPPVCDFIIQTYDTAFSTRTTADSEEDLNILNYEEQHRCCIIHTDQMYVLLRRRQAVNLLYRI